MKTITEANSEQSDIIIGPFTFSVNMIMLLIGALAMLAYLVALNFGVQPDQAVSVWEKLGAMNVIWSVMVMCCCLPLAYICNKAGHTSYSRAIALMGVGLFCGALMSTFV